MRSERSARASVDPSYDRPTSAFGRWERRLLYAGVLLAGILILVISRQHDALAERHRALSERLQWPHAGYSVPTFEAVTIDGDSVVVGRSEGGRQLLIFFTTECPYCRASTPAWRRIAAAVDEGRAPCRRCSCWGSCSTPRAR